MARNIINPEASAGTLKFAASEGALSSGTDFSGQVTDFQIVPSANTVKSPATLGYPATEEAGKASYSIKFKILQDWGLGLCSKYLYDNEGTTVWFEYNPAGATVDSFKGQCGITGVGYGGSSDGQWTDDLTFPCPEKPTRVNAA